MEEIVIKEGDNILSYEENIVCFKNKKDFEKWIAKQYLKEEEGKVEDEITEAEIDDVINNKDKFEKIRIEGNSDLKLKTVLNTIDEIGIENIFFENRGDLVITEFYIVVGSKLGINTAELIQHSSDVYTKKIKDIEVIELYFD